MDCTVVKCKDCGTVMVVNTNELWKLSRCTKCESENISTIDDDFDFVEVIDNEQRSKED